MSALEEKRIVIKLPSLRWSSFLRLRFLLLVSLLLFSSLFAYWYHNIHPFLMLHSAHVEAYSSMISSDAAGRIVEMGPQEGDFVRKGQTLFVLDRDLILAKQLQVKLVLDSLDAQIEMEKERIGKAMELYLAASNESPDLVKKQLSLMEEAQERAEEAASRLPAAKNELGVIDLQLKKMALVAPFDGVILKRSKNPGAVVSFGDPVYILSDPNQTWIETEVPESALGSIAVGASARIRLAAYPKKEFLGKVSYIGPATVAKSSFTPSLENKGMIPIQISIESGNLSLRPGLSADVALKVR